MVRRAAPRPRCRPAPPVRASPRCAATGGSRRSSSPTGPASPLTSSSSGSARSPNTEWLAGQRAAAHPGRARMRRDAHRRRRSRHPRCRRHRVLAAPPGRRRRDPHRALDRRGRAGPARRPQRPAGTRKSARPTTSHRTSGPINTRRRSNRSACPGARTGSSSSSRPTDGARFVYGGERDGRLVGVVAINAARRLGAYRMALADPPDFDDSARRRGRRREGAAPRLTLNAARFCRSAAPSA